MPRPRFKRLPADKQSRIIEAAGREFARHGYERASLNAIIESAGISKGAFYYYFDDKADLFATILQRVHEAVFEADDQLDLDGLTRENFWAAVTEITRRSLDYTEQHPWMPQLSRTLNRHPDEFGAPLQRFLEESLQVMRGFIVRGRELGVIRSDVPESLLIAMVSALDRAVDAWFSEAWADLGSEEAARVTHIVVEMFRGLCESR